MTEDDPFLWLEDVEGDRALAWVREQNARTLAAARGRPALSGPPRRRAPDRHRAGPRSLSAVSWRESWRISGRTRPMCAGCGGAPRWPRTAPPSRIGRRSSTSTRSPPPRARTGCSRAGSPCRPTSASRLIGLSDGGKDASEWREFDTAASAFIDGGFFLPEGKQSASWLDADTLLVGRDWGPGTMTASGYPFILKRLAARHAARRRPRRCFAGRPKTSTCARRCCAIPMAGYAASSCSGR